MIIPADVKDIFENIAVKNGINVKLYGKYNKLQTWYLNTKVGSI